MAINFPATPVNGDTHVVGNVTYVYDNAKAKWNGAGQTPNDRLTEGSNKLEIDGSNNLVWTGNNVGIGLTNPVTKLQVAGNLTVGPISPSNQYEGILIVNGKDSSSAETISFLDGRNNLGIPDSHMWMAHETNGGSYIRFDTTPAGNRTTDRREERLRVDSDGRLLVGLTASVDSNSTLQVEGRNTITAIRYSAATGNAGSKLELSRSASNTVGTTAAVSATDELGEIRFRGASTGSAFNTGASINAVVALGTISASSFPTDLLFKTTSNGSASAIERLRIDSAGKVLAGNYFTSKQIGFFESALQIQGTTGDTSSMSIFRYSADAGGPNITLGKGRGSAGAVDKPNNDDTIGAIRFQIANNNNLIDGESAKIECNVDNVPGGGDYPSRLTFYTADDGANSVTERFRIKSNGDLKHTGLRAGGGQNKLAILVTPSHNTNEEDVIVYQVENESLFNQITFGGGTSGYNAATALIFKTASAVDTTGGTGRLRINSNGRVDIGNELGVTHAGFFQVINTGGGQQDNDCLTFFETNGNDWCIKTNFNTSGAHYHAHFLQEGGTRATIAGSSGQNAVFTSGSDHRLKENVVDLTDAEGIDLVKNLKPRKYNWISNRTNTGEINTVNGFIAHEVEEAGVGHLVYGNGKDAVKKDGSIDTQTLDYAGMTPVLAAAIKGLISKVEDLEQRLSAASL